MPNRLPIIPLDRVERIRTECVICLDEFSIGNPPMLTLCADSMCCFWLQRKTSCANCGRRLYYQVCRSIHINFFCLTFNIRQECMPSKMTVRNLFQAILPGKRKAMPRCRRGTYMQKKKRKRACKRSAWWDWKWKCNSCMYVYNNCMPIYLCMYICVLVSSTSLNPIAHTWINLHIYTFLILPFNECMHAWCMYVCMYVCMYCSAESATGRS